MSNNDEFVFYSEEQQSKVKDYSHIARSEFDDPHLVISRPVHSQELKNGLNVSFRGDRYKEKSPEITKALDDFFKLKTTLEEYSAFNVSSQKALIMIIANSFYDCMSGGAGKYFLAACRYFIYFFNIPSDTVIYMEKDTVEDFLRQIKDIPPLENLLNDNELKLLI